MTTTRGSSVATTCALALLLSLGGYALGRKTAPLEPRAALPLDVSAELEARLTARAAELERRAATLNQMQNAPAKAAAPLPAPERAAPPPSPAVSTDEDGDPIETPETIAMFDDARSFIDQAIASRATWDDTHRNELRAKTRGLSASQLQTVMSGLAVAMNTKQVTVTAFPPM